MTEGEMMLKVALIFSQSACSLVGALSFLGENEARRIRGESPAYTEEAFAKILELHNDAVQSVLKDLKGNDESLRNQGKTD